MPYAILRFEKRKGGPASALEKHHERKKNQYASNPDIDRERSKPESKRHSGKTRNAKCARTA